MAEIIEGKVGGGFSSSPTHFLIFPDLYNEIEDTFPVVYLLHGLFGERTNWIEFTKAAEYADKTNLILAAHDGNDSWYVGEHERYFTEELVPFVDTTYRTKTGREHRGIAGISMGGYGALKTALKRPDLFSFAASMSGAFDGPRQRVDRPGTDWDIMGASLIAAFGTGYKAIRAENDIFELAEKAAGTELPKIYFDCGTADQFIAVNRRLKSEFERHGVAAEYKEFPGAHDWEYWDTRLNAVLEMAMRNLS